MLTCEQARGRAITIIAATRNGVDPAARRDAERRAITVRELAERFEKEHVDLRLKPSTAKGYKRMLERFVLPRLGNLRVSPFGVIAMWAIFAVALLAALRRRLGLRTWRIAHMSLAVVIVVGSVIHGMLIEGTMESMSKAALCALVLAATIKVMADLRVWRKRATSRGESPAQR